jgi:hypothetical protein
LTSPTFGITKAILECDLQHGWVEIVVERGCGEWLQLVDDVANRDECRPIDRSTEGVALLRHR